MILFSCQAVSSFALIPKSSRFLPSKSQLPTKTHVFSPYSDSKSYRSSSLGAYNEALNLMMTLPRGGASVMASVTSKVSAITSTPSGLFNTALVALALTTATFKVLQQSSQKFSSMESNASNKVKPKSISSLQIRYLTVFWLIRCADWLQGPYFYEVYASKVFNGVQASMGLVSKLFLTGFASTALFGPLVGRAADVYGRKRGTLAFCLIYALGAASTKSPLLSILLMGRVLSGIGTSLLFSAPESWLVGESQKSGDDPDGSYLGETFGRVRYIPYLNFLCSLFISTINQQCH
jgi:MFS transporter, MFS domain-containing protein family, molybdate-anion transporter